MKKKMFFMLFVFLMFTFLNVVNASDDVCSNAMKNQLKEIASNIEITYVTGESDVETTDVPVSEQEKLENKYYLKKYYFDIKIYNVNSKVKIKGIDESTGNIYDLNYRNIGSDGTITIRVDSNSEKVLNWKFIIYSNYFGCYEDVLRTIKLTLPMYNHHSELSACDDVPDYYVCHQYVMAPIKVTNVNEAIAQYKKKLNETKKEQSSSVENTVTEAISNIVEHKYVIVLVVIFIGLIATIVVLLKNKRRS